MSAPPNDTTGRLNYVEFSVASIGKTKNFYQEAFGWALVDFGPTYAASVSGDVDVGLQPTIQTDQSRPFQSSKSETWKPHLREHWKQERFL